MGGIYAVDVLYEQLVSLLRYLEGKLEKYARPSDVGCYVKLVRNSTRAKLAASIGTAEQVESWTARRVSSGKGFP